MSYVAEITSFFKARFPEAAELDASDYTTIAEWEKQEIPMALVRRAINDVYYDCKEKGVDIESIGHCEETVKSNFRDWLKAKAVRK